MAYMAIETRYLGPTDYRGSRIKATARDTFYSDERPKSVTVPLDYALGTGANHERAALALLPKVCNNPDGVTLHKGATKRGYVFVAVPTPTREGCPLGLSAWDHLRVVLAADQESKRQRL